MKKLIALSLLVLISTTQVVQAQNRDNSTILRNSLSTTYLAVSTAYGSLYGVALSTIVNGSLALLNEISGTNLILMQNLRDDAIEFLADGSESTTFQDFIEEVRKHETEQELSKEQIASVIVGATANF